MVFTSCQRYQCHWTFAKLFTERLKGLIGLNIVNQPTLQFRRSRSDLIYLFNILNNLTDANLESFITVSPIITSSTHKLRGNAFKLNIPKPRTDLLKFSYVNRVIKCWNGLPIFVCDSPYIAVFKKRLSEHMFDRVFWYLCCFRSCVGISGLLYSLSGLHTFVLSCNFTCIFFNKKFNTLTHIHTHTHTHIHSHTHTLELYIDYHTLLFQQTII